MRDTQQEAWQEIQPTLSASRQIVREAIRLGGRDGKTLFELQVDTGWSVNRLSGRVTELARAQEITDCGLRRINPASGKRGIAWVSAGKNV